MADTTIIVINAKTILSDLDREYQCQMAEWKSQCLSVHSNFKKKTSRSNKNGKSYESTAWYKIKPGGSLKSVGKKEPDYSKYYPPEPKPAYSFKSYSWEEHVILNIKDYEANLKLFKDCLAFNLELCRNASHPLIKNPQKAMDSIKKRFANDGGHIYEMKDSVWTCGVSSAGSPWEPGQTGVPISPGENCLGDGDCDECEHQDECPVGAEE